MDTIRDRFNKALANKLYIEKEIKSKKEMLKSCKARNKIYSKAKNLVIEAAKITQQEFQNKTDELTSIALKRVFGRDFNFHLNLKRESNRLAVYPEITEGTETHYDIEKDMGGSMMDIASFALRIVFWSMKTPRSRNVILLDEPMKNLGSLTPLGGATLKTISEKIGIQLIIVTHDPEMAKIGDSCYEIKRIKGVSTIVGDTPPPKKTKRVRF